MVARLLDVILKSFVNILKWLSHITSLLGQKTESEVGICVSRFLNDYAFVCFNSQGNITAALLAPSKIELYCYSQGFYTVVILGLQQGFTVLESLR
jgi:hypothetical protein